MTDSIGGLLAGLLIGFISSGLLGFAIANDNWQQQTVNRGLAAYCPLDGEWAWLGECKERN